MKKTLALILTICLIATSLCITAFATNDNVLTVSALKDGETVKIADYKNFEDGWNAAMKLADDKDGMKDKGYDRIVVDLYADWEAVDGEFTDDTINGSGFNWDAIYFQDGVSFTLNMNGHTIDRKLTEREKNGEVMYIDADADVIINNGTIKGGWSDNGAGGIFVNDDAKLTLNNVHIVGNKAENDNGGGISIENGAELVMNGGSFEDNSIIGTAGGFNGRVAGGAIDVEGSFAVFNNVLFKENLTESSNVCGAAIYAKDSQITLSDCTIEKNGFVTRLESKKADSVIYGKSSTFTIKDSTFKNNYATSLLSVIDSTLTIDTSEISQNVAVDILIKILGGCAIYATDTTFSDNNSAVVSGTTRANEEDGFFRNCTFRNNHHPERESFAYIESTLTFYDCNLGDSTFDEKSMANIVIENADIPDEDVVLSVSMLLEDGTSIPVRKYDNLVLGWSAAMRLASTGKETNNSYSRVIVDLYVDWKAKEGEFSNSGVGFDWDAIHFPDNVSVTLNMNGHTIDRGLETVELNGEVISIGTNADVIINDGTIKGGASTSGAGGIHIKDNAKVVLKDVNVIENEAAGSNGAGIAVYDGATLVMEGGSISDNSMSTVRLVVGANFPYGSLYLNEATVTLNNVIISGNSSSSEDAEGVAIYADESTLTLNNCVVSGNATKENGSYAESVMGAVDSTLIITNTDFTGNGAVADPTDRDNSYLFYLEDCNVTMEGGKVTGNSADELFYVDDSNVDKKKVTITDNASLVFNIDNSSEKVTLTDCVMGSNSPVKYDVDVIFDTAGTLVFAGCDLGDTKVESKEKAKGVGSLVGNGSLTAIVAFLALAGSVAAIGISVSAKQKKAALASASVGTDEE